MIIETFNCPNCGAPIVGDKCEYCGTIFRFIEKPIPTERPIPRVNRINYEKNEEYKKAILIILEKYTGVRVLTKFLWFKEEILEAFSVSDIQEFMPYLSTQKLCVLLLSLEKNGFIKKRVDKGKAMWYI